jgi:hypothetical protein
MKKKYYFLALIVAVLQAFNLQAATPTDVTDTYLQNANFNQPPYAYTVEGGTVLTEGVERHLATGWMYAVPGWTHASIVNANAVQIATGEYGTVANSNGFNGVAVPATDRNGNSVGAAVSMSAGWGDQGRLTQDVSLPSGRYVLKVDVYNAHTPVNAIRNFVGFKSEYGTEYYSNKLNFTMGEWLQDSVSFFLADDMPGVISIGYTTSSGGSGNGPKFFMDNVKLYYYGIDKSILMQWIDSATVLINNREDVGESTVYDDLQIAIDAAQGVYDTPTATASQVVLMEEVLKEAIAEVHGAIMLQYRKNTWVNLPVDATEAVLNPSFENIFADGWINEGPFQRQTNASFDPYKVGTYYAERWISGGGSLQGLRLTQLVTNIPNGTYLVTASAHAVQQADGSYPGGAYLIGNGNVTEIFERKDYAVLADVVDNTLELGMEVAATGNWVAIDNFRLTYLSDGSPYLIVTPGTVNFTPSTSNKTFTVSGGNLTENVTLATTSNFQLSATSLTPAEAEMGADITITSIATSVVDKDSVVITHGDVSTVVYLSISEKINVTAGALFFDQTLPTSGSFELTGDVYGDVTISAPDGMILSSSSVSANEVLTGSTVLLIWDGASRIENKYIYLSSGSVKDSVLVFAVSDNIISYWDGDDAEGDGSELINFGWSLMMADGVTPVAGAFNQYNAGSGIRYVPVTTQNYTYNGKPWQGGRLAYLRTWGDPPTNVFNLSVQLTAGQAYAFRGVAAWHDNETAPTFTYGINTEMSNTGDTLAMQSNYFPVRRAAADYAFTFVPKTTGTHYLTISSNVKGDVMNSPLYLAIYETLLTSTPKVAADDFVNVYPTVTNTGRVMIETAGKIGLVRAFDVTGKLIATAPLNGGVEELNLPNEGVFFLQLQVENTSKTVKVIRVK